MVLWQPSQRTKNCDRSVVIILIIFLILAKLIVLLSFYKSGLFAEKIDTDETEKSSEFNYRLSINAHVTTGLYSLNSTFPSSTTTKKLGDWVRIRTKTKPLTFDGSFTSEMPATESGLQEIIETDTSQKAVEVEQITMNKTTEQFRDSTMYTEQASFWPIAKANESREVFISTNASNLDPRDAPETILNITSSHYTSTKTASVPHDTEVTNAEEPGDNFTVVTALLEIGRSKWWNYRRTMETYHKFLDYLLHLNVNILIFIDREGVNRVHGMRKMLGLEHRTKIIPFTLQQLPFYAYIQHAEEIIRREQLGISWNPNWDDDMKKHPEAKSAIYNILVNSKPFFLHKASIENNFYTRYFVWLDAGYGHGDRSVFPREFVWKPNFPQNQISLIKLTPPYDELSRYTIHELYRKNHAVIAGGFIAGDHYAIRHLYSLYYQVFIDNIHDQRIDDDQTTMVLVIRREPSLFHIVHGDWFDALKLF